MARCPENSPVLCSLGYTGILGWHRYTGLSACKKIKTSARSHYFREGGVGKSCDGVISSAVLQQLPAHQVLGHKRCPWHYFSISSLITGSISLTSPQITWFCLITNLFIAQLCLHIHQNRIQSWSRDSQSWQHATQWEHRAEPEHEAPTLHRSAESREPL